MGAAGWCGLFSGDPGMKSNPRPRKYASDAERQAAFRARNVLVEFRAEPKTADKLTEIAAAIDVSRSDLLLSMVKFALTNHDWARFGLTHKTIPLYQGNPIMATKKASPAQIAARKRFAEMARSGELAKTRKKAVTRVKKNPEPSHDFARIGKPFSYDGRTWKVSGYSHNGKTVEAYTTDRKKFERRVFNVAELMAGRGIGGLESLSKNPTTKKLYTVCRADAKGNPVYHIAHFTKQADAKQYAQAYADLNKTPVVITSKAM